MGLSRAGAVQGTGVQAALSWEDVYLLSAAGHRGGQGFFKTSFHVETSFLGCGGACAARKLSGPSVCFFCSLEPLTTHSPLRSVPHFGRHPTVELPTLGSPQQRLSLAISHGAFFSPILLRLIRESGPREKTPKSLGMYPIHTVTCCSPRGFLGWVMGSELGPEET